MPRYIDAERKVNAQYYDEMHEEWLWKETSIDDVLAEILDSEVPTADVQEVKHGKWEEKHHSYSDEECVIEEWQSCRCSECGRYDTRPYMYYFSEPKFCSFCGAKMAGKEKANEKD